MSGKHIPGPWAFEVGTGAVSFVVTAPDGDSESPWNVAGVVGDCGYPDDATEANARLIAAAPELLEALKSVRDHAQISAEHMAIIDGVIAKAEGIS